MKISSVKIEGCRYRENSVDCAKRDGEIGSRVRMRRLMPDMSQQSLADAIGLTFQQIKKYEKRTNRMGWTLLGDVVVAAATAMPRKRCASQACLIACGRVRSKRGRTSKDEDARGLAPS
jgi:DNA-binding XRE family transcriptional regulator